jgi:hypothetical protein
MIVARSGHTATWLTGGKVLVAGGHGDGSPLSAVEAYDPAANAWSNAANLGLARSGHTATLLPNGKVLMARGSSFNSSSGTYPTNTEVYDPTIDEWRTGGDTSYGDRHAASLLPSGNVLVTGGGAGPFALSGADIFDASSGTPISTNASLGNLTISAGPLTPPFAHWVTSYSAAVANNVTSMTVTPTVADGTATVKVNGTTATSGSASLPVTLSVGSNAVTVLVTAQNGTTSKAYTINVTRAPGMLDIDASSTATKYDALTDGLLIIRYLFGLTGTSLTTGAVGATATRTDPVAIKAYLDSIRPALDIDGNGTADALTDGLLVIRYLFGLRGDALIAGAVEPLATRKTASDIAAYLQTLVP